jgi:Tfp pilus assembly protein PilO
MSLWRRIFAERRRFIVPLAGVLIVNVAVLALAVLPLRRVVANAEDAARHASFEAALGAKRQRDAQAARESRDRAEKDLQKFYADVLPTDLESAVGVTFLEIDHIASETNLVWDRRHFEPVKVKNSHLAEYRTLATLTGTYQNIRRFLYQLEIAQSFLIVESVALAPAKQLKVDNGTLQVTVTITTYYRGDL